MKIKRCSYFINENSKDDFEKLDYMYHSIDEKDYNNVMKNGLLGEIYLTKTPDEAREYHPLVLKIDIKNRDLNIKEDGKCSVMGVTIDKIIKYDNIDMYMDYEDYDMDEIPLQYET
jgi:hypothetical protein